MSHPLSQHPLPGIDPRRLEQLSQGGLASLEDVIDAGPERLAELTGFDLKTCRALVRVAASALEHQDPGVIHLAPLREDLDSNSLARGLEAARDIEVALSCVRKARAWSKRCGEPRRRKRRTRRQLNKLRGQLQGIQQSVLSAGISSRAKEQLSGELQLFLAAAETLLESPASRASLSRMRRVSKSLRRSL